MYQQLWGYKVEEKLYLGVREQRRLNTTDDQIYVHWHTSVVDYCTFVLFYWYQFIWYESKSQITLSHRIINLLPLRICYSNWEKSNYSCLIFHVIAFYYFKGLISQTQIFIISTYSSAVFFRYSLILWLYLIIFNLILAQISQAALQNVIPLCYIYLWNI
jgi:hypothetical protein